MIYDAAIIGAGVIGSMIARELSMLDIRVCLIEAKDDVASGASRANSGIVHAGYDAKPGSFKAKFNVLGCAMMKQTTDELGVPFENCGSLVVAFNKQDELALAELKRRGDANGVPTQILTGAQAREIDPMLSEKITSALYAKSAGIVCPFSLTIAASENAIANGVKLYLNSEVTDIARKDGVYEIAAGERDISARIIVNAAGLYSDEISKMAGAEQFIIKPRKGEYIVFDKEMKARTNNVIFRAPTKLGKGVLLAPTVYRNMLAGPTAQNIEDKQDKATSPDGLKKVLNSVIEYVPSIERGKAITVFAGLRAKSPTHDFIIGASQSADNFVNVAGIESPGLSSAPAIAQHVKDLLVSLGLSDKKDPSATRKREPIEVFANATLERKKQMIASDKNYANIVCRCEYVTEAEIIESIRRGARTVDGVKFRAAAGTGRCHGGFCMPRVMDILARELSKDYSEIQKSGKGSRVLTGKTKEAL
ncbi:MAG: NAD(P)/FAD-dependent oxidoreductase [Clostridia bacterium]|nr:NAD(P)/FAD-dependent oxidoreductase [Clostridia bacterium]MBT7123437.1 NAD(P)/FAD-dependent oxidoreductase [Clostridia bacterium]